VQILTREGTFQTRAISGTIPWGSTVPPSNSQIGMGSAGVRIDETTALALDAVYGSVSLISDAISTLPILQWRQVGSEARQMDVAPVIAQPWPEIEQQDFIGQGTLSMLLRGMLWGKVTARDDRLYPAQVQLVHPDHARIRRRPDNGQLEVHYWNESVPLDDVTRRMAMSVPEGIKGLSPIEYLRNSFGLARAQDLYSGAFYANSARPDGWIGVKDDLDEDETEAMMATWDEAHGGIGRSHRPAILTGGAEFNAITMSMADAQFLEQMQYSASRISGMIYRIPPHMLGMVDKDSSWGAGIEQQMIGFVRDTLGIWLRRWEDLMRSWLPPRQFVTFDLSERLRGDALQRWSAYQIARVMGAMNNAEVRAEEKLPKVTDTAQAAVLEAYDAPLNSAPVKPTSTGGAGGDKSN
jgi:HK97 family phage portal protein